MRYAICNETFEGWDHARVCRFVAGLGYTGPGGRARSRWPAASPTCRADRRRELRQQAEDRRRADHRPALAAGQDRGAAC